MGVEHTLEPFPEMLLYRLCMYIYIYVVYYALTVVVFLGPWAQNPGISKARSYTPSYLIFTIKNGLFG